MQRGGGGGGGRGFVVGVVGGGVGGGGGESGVEIRSGGCWEKGRKISWRGTVTTEINRN